MSKLKVFADTKVSVQDYEILLGWSRRPRSMRRKLHTSPTQIRDVTCAKVSPLVLFYRARYLVYGNRQKCLIIFDNGNEQSPREPNYN